MTFSIPKSAAPHNSMFTPTVIPIDFNDADIDRMLTKILEMGVKLGRTATSSIDTTAYGAYLDKLQTSPSVIGFSGEGGRDVLDGWVKSSVLVEERKGRSKSAAQMGYLRPLTIAGYRSGLPKNNRNRRADTVAYQSMVRFLDQRGSVSPAEELQVLIKKTFGHGVNVGVPPWHDPRYDETTDVDIDTLLALRFLEGFVGSQNYKKDDATFDPPVPSAVDALGQDLVTFLELYGPTLPVAEAYAHISTILSVRLFQLPIITAQVAHALLDRQGLPREVRLETYCDFVRRRGSASDEVSQRCVLRDLEIFRRFFGDRLLLRTLHHSRSLIPGFVPPEQDASHDLESIAASQDDPLTQMALQFTINQIYTALEDDSEGRNFIDEIRAAKDLNVVQQVRQILVEGLGRYGIRNQVSWFHSTGGISKAYGVLAGTQRVRSSWRYAPSDEALMTLVMMSFINDPGSTTASRLGIQELLDRLRQRYGILIDEPPAAFDSADARAGATENRSAFAQRLKLLGCFQGLSDDFSAQFVTRPREAIR